MNQTTQDPNIITFKGRLSFPCLNLAELEQRKKRALQKKSRDGKSMGDSYSAIIILDKATAKAQIDAARALIIRIASETWKDKTVLVKGHVEKLVNQDDPKAEKVVLLSTSLHDGEEKADKDGFGDHVMYISSSRSQQKGPPKVVDKTMQEIRPEESHYPYAGCYVHVSVRMWAQDNDFGKRVNAETRVIVFDKHGEPFGAAPVDVGSDFAGVNLDDEEETAPVAPKKAAKDISIDDM